LAENKSPFRWVVLLLTVLVNLCANGMNLSCMPSLYGEIVRDIPMTHTQWGAVWGASFIPAVIFSLIGGMCADRVGTRSIVGFAVILTGIFGIGRAFAQDFSQLIWLMLLLGISSSFLRPNLPKSLGHWFPPGELGLANGFLIAGLCVGAGSALMLSGVYLSPLVGGWRRVMWLYGLLSIVSGALWLLIFREGQSFSHNHPAKSKKFDFREAITVVIRARDLWFLMASRFCIVGSIFAVIGFLPELLVSKGMKPSLAHLSSSLIYYVNIVGVIVVPIISDKVGLRKVFIWPFSLLGALLVILLGVFDGISSLIICAFLGLIVGFIPLMMTIPMEMDGIGHRYMGTALGLSLSIGNLGNFVVPLLGGKIIDLTGKELTAFIFWGILMIIGALFILPMKETGSKLKLLPVIGNPVE
jgi:MFS family permease